MKLSTFAARFGAAVFLAAVFSFAAAAQTGNPENKKIEIPATANENFELNTAEKRISETNFERATAVEVRGTTGSAVGVGASVRAGTINILLRGVTGNVRFRASLESIRQRIESLTEKRPATDSRAP